MLLESMLCYVRPHQGELIHFPVKRMNWVSTLMLLATTKNQPALLLTKKRMVREAYLDAKEISCRTHGRQSDIPTFMRF